MWLSFTSPLPARQRRAGRGEESRIFHPQGSRPVLSYVALSGLYPNYHSHPQGLYPVLSYVALSGLYPNYHSHPQGLYPVLGYVALSGLVPNSSFFI